MIGRFGLSYERYPGAGLVVYSSHSGLFFAVHQRWADHVAGWLSGRDVDIPSEIRRILASAQGSPSRSLAIASESLLPAVESWENQPQPSGPFVVNWLISGSCSLRCGYCYAQDLMHENVSELNASGVRHTAEVILGYRPVVVVLTGGDPLVSQHFESAVEALSGRCAVVLDTNGVHLNASRIALAKEHGMMVRISMDGESIGLSRRLRPTASGAESATAALDAICGCLEAGVPVTVQSVATKANLPNLHRFGDKLHKMGVHAWRILRVVNSRDRSSGYYQAIGGPSAKARDEFDDNWKHFVHGILPARRRTWSDRMAALPTGGTERNSVVLVAPDGRFYTESATRNEKQLLDPESPKMPSPEAIYRSVDLAGHARRYLHWHEPNGG